MQMDSDIIMHRLTMNLSFWKDYIHIVQLLIQQLDNAFCKEKQFALFDNQNRIHGDLDEIKKLLTIKVQKILKIKMTGQKLSNIERRDMCKNIDYIRLVLSRNLMKIRNSLCWTDHFNEGCEEQI